MSKRRKKKKLKSEGIRSAVIKCFLKNPKKRLNAGTLIKKMKINGNRDAVHACMQNLRNEDILRQVSDNKFVLNRKHKVAKAKSAGEGTKSKLIYQGTVETIKSGAAYILVDSMEDDVYVPAHALKGAFNGDEVEISVVFKKGRKPEGKVKKIVARNTPQVMGVLRAEKKKFSSLELASRRLKANIKIAKEHYNGAKDGDRVLVDIIHWPTSAEQPIWAEVSKVFKNLDDHNWTMESILVENGFMSEHTPASMKEAAKFPAQISEDEVTKRRDFRDILTFTIDPDTAQDFDDAISYEVLDNGHIEVGVHIADVTHFLQPGTALDKEAYDRSTSVYLVDRCIPMLPERLSNNLCSLMPNVDRLVFSAVFTFDKKYKMVSEWFGKGIIHSDRRFKDGAINFDSDEVKFKLDKKNKPVGVFVKQRKDVHLLIEDFMLLANRRVARFIASKEPEKQIPFVYRIHDHPDLDRVAELATFMKEFGLELDFSSPEKISESYNKLDNV